MMTLQQQAMNVIEHLPDDKLSQVIQFAEFLSLNSGSDVHKGNKAGSEAGYVREPGILKRKMVMADDFDETPECFKEYI